jgi:hypothetical protein
MPLDEDTLFNIFSTSPLCRGLSAPEVEEGPVSGPQETAGYPRFGLGSK